MDITAFIRELLFNHDCVIIPGFGGFIGNYTPARIDKSTSTFYPPVKQISFNRNLNHNDGLLVGKISGSANIPYGDARNIVDEFAASLRKKLEKGEKVTFDNIGSFTSNQEGNLQFEPDRSVNYHLNSYGLETFQFLPLESYDVRKRVIKHIDKGPVMKPASRKIFWRAAVIVPLLAVLITIPFTTDVFKSKVEAGNMNPLVKAEFESNKKAVDENTPAVAVIPADNNISSEPAAAETRTVSAETSTYCLITGSFKTRTNAEIQAGMLKKDGFIPEIVNGPNGFYRVSAMKCPDLPTALVKKDIIAKKFPGTWVKKI